jgi:dTMP kinase
MARGLLITLEGGEGCGKSTQARRLAERLRAGGRTVVEAREPGGTPLGEKLRDLLKHDPAGFGMAPETEALLLNASRAELVRRVFLPALAAGSIVVCDRFYDSTLAYQGAGRGLDLPALRGVIGLATGGLKPDLTLLLRASAEVAAARVATRTSATDPADRFEAEQSAFFDRVGAAFDALAASEPLRFRLIDANGSLDEVAAAAWAAVAPICGLPSPAI